MSMIWEYVSLTFLGLYLYMKIGILNMHYKYTVKCHISILCNAIWTTWTLCAQWVHSLFTICQIFISLPSLFQILLNILGLKLSHPLNFIQVDHKAFIIWMELFNAFSAENGLMVWTIKMLDSVWMDIAELLYHDIFLFIIKLKITISQLIVFFNNFVQYVDVQWKSFCTV